MITGSNDKITQVLYSVLPGDIVDMVEVYRRDLFREYCLQQIKKYPYVISSSYYSHGSGTYEHSMVVELSCHCHQHCIYRKLALFQSGSTPIDDKQYKSNLRNPSMTLILFPAVQHGFFIHSNDLAAVDTSLLQSNADIGSMFQSENESRIIVFDTPVPPYLVNYIIEFPRLIQRFKKETWPQDFKELCKIMESNINGNGIKSWSREEPYAGSRN
jgi:hypothetical protein